jgi:hypothetical protein
VSHHRLQALTFATAATLTLSPATAQNPIHLSATPPKVQLDEGPSLSLGRVGLNPCPDNFCRPEPQGNLFYFMTKGTHPIEPVPGFVLTIPFGGGGH